MEKGILVIAALSIIVWMALNPLVMGLLLPALLLPVLTTWFLTRDSLEKSILLIAPLIISSLVLNPLVLGSLMSLLLPALLLVAFIKAREIEAKKRMKKFQNIQSALLAQPCPLNSLLSILFSLRSMTWLNCSQSEWIYKQSLEILAANPSNLQAKEFALETGRWHKGRLRKGKLITIFDKQRIKDDLMVRSR
ncbi:MAG: hypothetical protein WCA07_07175 [Gloeobacterales cyanobacterium]